MSQDLDNTTTEDHLPANTDGQMIEAALLAALYRRDCPDTMQLGAYQQDLLAKPERNRLQTHLNRCPHCRAEVARLNEFLAQDAPVSTPTPKRREVKWLKGRGFEWRARKAGKIVVRLAAQLLSASAPAPLAVKGHRPTTDDPDVIRRITLTPEETGNLDLSAVISRIPDDPQHCTLQVQVEIPSRWPELAGTPVKAQASNWQARGITDEEGWVVFEGLPAELLESLVIEVESAVK